MVDGEYIQKNSDGTIDIIHAGTPEAYYSPTGTNCGFKSEYILTGTKNSSDTSTITSGVTARDWSMYEDCSTDSVTTSYAVAGSARCDNAPLWGSRALLLGANQWFAVTNANGQGLIYGGSPNNDGQLTIEMGCETAGCMGVRPIVTIRLDAKVAASGANQTTHTTPETAWNLCM